MFIKLRKVANAHQPSQMSRGLHLHEGPPNMKPFKDDCITCLKLIYELWNAVMAPLMSPIKKKVKVAIENLHRAT